VGAGPAGGTEAATVDSAAAALMGFDPGSVGHLYYLARWGYGCADPAAMTVEGPGDWRSRAVKFRPHPSHPEQLRWRIDGAAPVRIEEELAEEGVARRQAY